MTRGLKMRKRGLCVRRAGAGEVRRVRADFVEDELLHLALSLGVVLQRPVGDLLHFLRIHRVFHLLHERRFRIVRLLRPPEPVEDVAEFGVEDAVAADEVGAVLRAVVLVVAIGVVDRLRAAGRGEPAVLRAEVELLPQVLEHRRVLAALVLADPQLLDAAREKPQRCAVVADVARLHVRGDDPGLRDSHEIRDVLRRPDCLLAPHAAGEGDENDALRFEPGPVFSKRARAFAEQAGQERGRGCCRCRGLEEISARHGHGVYLVKRG
ncbi:MAG: hypothetical protein FD180_4145 [Planctomycetota bacterium]|nr:MAG: hypothetical protein FD180_4145 [Planctomycetota bacterium]